MDPPAQPTHARVKAVGEDWAELEWRQPARSPPVDGWAIAIQAGGVGGFGWALPHTRCTTTRAVLQGLDAGTWYEFRVTAVNAAGPGPHSVPTRPVVTAMAPQSAPSARELLSAELQDELEYARLRRRILRWDGEFEAMHGSPPTDEHRRDSEAYGEMVRKFGELRATRRGRRGRRRSEEFEMAPLGLGGRRQVWRHRPGRAARLAATSPPGCTRGPRRRSDCAPRPAKYAEICRDHRCAAYSTWHTARLTGRRRRARQLPRRV